MFVLYRNLNSWTDLDEIWHGGGTGGGAGSWVGFNPVTPPNGYLGNHLAHLFSLRGHGQRRHGDVDLAGNEVADDARPAPVLQLVAVL